MQLNDILEENSIKAISDKTKIPEENLEYLVASEFDALTKVKTLGFISILEREYKADLSTIREHALEYYGQSREEHLFPLGQPIMDEHRSKSKILILFIFLLLGFSSWYFFTQFDKKHLNDLIPFMDEQTVESVISSDEEIKDENVAADLSIDKVIADIPKRVDSAVATPMSKTIETQEDREMDSVAEKVKETEVNTTQSIY